MRDLGIIPHIATEYKCNLIFKYFDLIKKQARDLSDEAMTQESFQASLYIIFSITLEEKTDITEKVEFIMQWLK